MKRHLLPFLLLLLPFAVRALDGQALAAYRENRFDEVQQILEGKNATDDRLLSCLAYREQFALYKNKDHRARADALSKILAVDLRFADIPTLLSLGNLENKPHGNREAVDLLGTVLKAPLSTGQTREVSALLAHPDAGVPARKEFLGALYRHTRNVRAYVRGGGRMPEDVKKLFEETTFLDPVVDALAVKELKSIALDVLEEVEEPSLAVLEARPSSTEVLEALAEVKGEVSRRQTKTPNATWYSAYP
jgi:hypothetical protein